MLNRKDAHTVLGGDTVQMLRTKEALEKLGVQVDTGSVEEPPAEDQYDLLHIFNWQQLEEYLALRGAQRGQLLPIVLSTIFWFYTGHWFDAAARTKPIWKLASGALGPKRARSLYEQWQLAKFRRGAEGQRLRQCLEVPVQFLPNSAIELDHLESVLRLHGELHARCTVVPNAVAREVYDPLPQPSQKLLKKVEAKDFVLQVARIQEAKNQLGLIEALFDLPVPIVFAGQPSPYEQEYVNRCYELAQKRGQVYFLGPISGDDLVSLYTLAAVHALPSWRETPGLASLEAAAAGCRVVTTSVGSTREYFGDLAWYCDPRDAQSIRRAVCAALESPRSDELRKTVLTRYTWDAAAAATLKAYQLALGEKPTH
jgi:glycosyltransferase involved in cell wall biosynthesis